jgi:signal transduction histidine kinase
MSAAGTAQQRFRVLLVEDNPGDARLVHEYLSEAEPQSWTLEHASTLAEAERRLKANSLDAALLDLNLPDAAGKDPVAVVCSLRPELPVVVLTGQDVDDAAALRAIHHRAQDFLKKGRIDGPLLARTLRYAMERKRLEEQLRRSQKLEAIGQLAGGIAHDFNNLLGVVLGNCDLLLKRGALGAEERRRVEEIARAAVRGAGLTRQFLALGRRQVLVPEAIPMVEELEDLNRMLTRLLHETIELRVSATPDAVVLGDRGQLEQVLINLAVNARDAMPGGGRLEIRADSVPSPEEARLPPGRYVRVVVSDTGQGMDAPTLARAFDAYFTTKAPSRGTGLGLTTSLRIVHESGGEIVVRSRPGEGTAFTIWLPAAEIPAPAPRPQPQAAAPRGRGRILLAEDEPMLRQILAEILADQGYQVLAAGRGDEALHVAAAAGGPIALLVADVVMPGITGAEVWRRLSAAQPGMRVLFLSGYNDEALVDSGILGEGLALLQKPFNLTALVEKVREVLDSPA